MRCVILWFLAQSQDMIVARMLSLDAHSVGGVPGDGTEPIKAAQHLGKELHDAVIALHMREFVRENGPLPRLRPKRGIRWKYDGLAKDAPGHRRNPSVAVCQ